MADFNPINKKECYVGNESFHSHQVKNWLVFSLEESTIKSYLNMANVKKIKNVD
jgi:hypothetical protein